MLNEPGALGIIATTIGEAGANIDNVVFNPSGSDFREVRFDLEVSDIQHLNAVLAQLRGKASSARSSGSAAEESGSMPLYFAYGANMDVEAMARRCPRSQAARASRA